MTCTLEIGPPSRHGPALSRRLSKGRCTLIGLEGRTPQQDLQQASGAEHRRVVDDRPLAQPVS